MTATAGTPQHLQIKKYPNRRFYDATRSCHVTLADMHDLVCRGYELSITDSATGQDITNLILTQIIIEHDPPKLEFFPASTLHQVIRTQQQMLGGVYEQFFRQFVEAHKASQAQWTRFLQNTLGLPAQTTSTPFDWAQAMFNAFTPGLRGSAANGPEAPAPPDNGAREHELQALKDQVSVLTQRVEQLSKPKPRPKPKTKSRRKS